jgi:hypothetical protein
LLAGTGADHRLTKWSAKACEDRAGMGWSLALPARRRCCGAFARMVMLNCCVC